MFCRKCGTKNADGSKFCSNCGAELASPQPTAQPAGPVPPQATVPQATPVAPAGAPVPPQGAPQQPFQQTAYQQPAASAKKSKAPLVIGGVVAVLAVLAVVGFVVMPMLNRGPWTGTMMLDGVSANYDHEFGIKTDGKTVTGKANAIISNAAVDAAKYSASANTATATSEGASRAYLAGATVAGAQKLTVRTTGASVALPEQGNSALSISGVGAGLVLLYANANGTFEAYIDTDNASVQAGAIEVSVRHEAKADAALSTPEKGVSASIGSAETNVALAGVGLRASAGIKGSGAVKTGALDVTAAGNAAARALVKKPEVAISGAKIAANVLTAKLTGAQSAYIDVAGLVAGNVSVTAKYNKGNTRDNAAAQAILGDTAVSASLANAQTHVLTAQDASAVEARVNLRGTGSTGKMNVLAAGSSTARAGLEGGAASVTLLGVGVVKKTRTSPWTATCP